MLGAEFALITKERPEQQVAEVTNVIGRVRGKVCVVIDDMIDTAGTLCAGGQALVEHGATRVFACATHPVFSGRAMENIAGSVFEQVVVTDTIPVNPVDRRRTRCGCCRLRRSWLIPSPTFSTTIRSPGCSTAGTSSSSEALQGAFDGPDETRGAPSRGARRQGCARDCGWPGDDPRRASTARKTDRRRRRSRGRTSAALRHAVSGPAASTPSSTSTVERREGRPPGHDQGPAARPGARPRDPRRLQRGAARPAVSRPWSSCTSRARRRA